MRWVYRSGELARGDWATLVDGTIEGWQHTGLRIADLLAGKTLRIAADGNERVIQPLAANWLAVSYRLTGQVDWQQQRLAGRASVFAGPADRLYLPRDCELEITGEGRVLVAEAPATRHHPVQFMAAADVPVFVRGAGRESRQVHNLGVPETLQADRLIVCEVIVPSGNWSGIPPHKHDRFAPGLESNLEEIYYFEASPMKLPAGASIDRPHTDPTGYVRVYASDERPIEISTEVRGGDVVLVPYGWHGPVAATPGSDLYFFNVMAGPDPDRAWLITDDPNYAWLREAWQTQQPDDRLPYSAAAKN